MSKIRFPINYQLTISIFYFDPEKGMTRFNKRVSKENSHAKIIFVKKFTKVLSSKNTLVISKSLPKQTKKSKWRFLDSEISY